MTAAEPRKTNQGVTLPDDDWFDDVTAIVALRANGSSVIAPAGTDPKEVVGGLLHLAAAMTVGAGAYHTASDLDNIEKFANGEETDGKG